MYESETWDSCWCSGKMTHFQGPRHSRIINSVTSFWNVYFSGEFFYDFNGLFHLLSLNFPWIWPLKSLLPSTLQKSYCQRVQFEGKSPLLLEFLDWQKIAALHVLLGSKMELVPSASKDWILVFGLWKGVLLQRGAWFEKSLDSVEVTKAKSKVSQD